MGAKQSGEFGWGTTSMEVMEQYSGGDPTFLKGKTAIVTGGNKGLGLEVVKSFVNAGCRVILCSRSVAAGEKAVLEEVCEPGHGGYTVSEEDAKRLITVMQLDLSSLKSVDKFMEQIKADEVGVVDYLFLNAGVMSLPTRETTDAGFEMQIGVNHFGHVSLTDKLVRHLEKKQQFKKAPIRVVVVSSIAWSILGNMSKTNLHFDSSINDREYTPWRAYGQSKLANAMYQPALDSVLRQKHKGSAAVAALPGLVKTDLWQHTKMKINTWGGWFADLIYPKKDVPQGASSLLYAALDPSFEGDQHDQDVKQVDNCQPFAWKGSKRAKFLEKESTDQFYDTTMQSLARVSEGQGK